MSNAMDVISWAANQGDNCPSLASIKAALGINDAPAHDTADANGFFKLGGITNPDYANIRVQVKELSDQLPPGSFQRASAELNLFEANGRMIGDTIGLGLQIEDAGQDPISGAKSYRLKEPQAILPDTRTFPGTVYKGFDLGTVAGVVAWVNALAPAGQGDSSGFTPH